MIDNNKTKGKSNDKGVALLMSVFIVLFVTLILSSSFVLISVLSVRHIQNFNFSMRTYYVAEGGLEDLILRFRNPLYDMPSSSPSTLTVGTGVATQTVSASGGATILASQGNYSSRFRKVSVVEAVTTTDAQFFYGIHVGDGGLSMGNNAIVNGSVFSDGDITGGNGSTITNDAILAGKTLTKDANWEVQNADYSVGYSATGAIITVVDSTNAVGEYISLALGSDGFARISYYDDTDGDLKFARCLDTDCTAKNITVVDSAGDVGWRYSSLALGSDGFARISYYDDTNNDLKFAQCTNDDCTTKNITSIDTTGDVGQFSSLALGSDGFARISYYDISAGDLNFIRCTNADCSTRVTTTVDSTNDVGKYTSLALGSDGFGRVSYINETSDDLKFVQCTDADCLTSVITSLDTGSDINQNTAITLGSDGFARISYYDDGSDNLKFVQCTNAACSSSSITTVDSGGDVGRYSSVELGSDQFARISYYDGTNGSVKFVRCTNASCTTSSIQIPDTAGDVGKYTSLVLGSDGFGRIAYNDDGSNDNLKFTRCGNDICSLANSQADVAQSFELSTANTPGKTSLYIRKVGNPSNATVTIMEDESGRPGDTTGQIVSTGTLFASSVGTSYGWVDVTFTSSKEINSGQAYWIMIDGGADTSNYWEWGRDSAGGYGTGSAKYSADWNTGIWSDVTGDLDFRVWIGGSKIQGMTIGSGSTGTARAQRFVSTTVHGSLCPNAYCIFENVARIELPFTDQVIQGWRDFAASGGTIVGDYSLINGAAASLGPTKITGKLTVDNGATLTITGTIWVQGDITFSNNSIIKLDSGYGSSSGVIMTDSKAVISNNVAFFGSGNPSSYPMLLVAKDSPSEEVLTVDNNALGVIYYASKGRIKFANNAGAKEATGYGITMDNNAVITYESGLQNLQFSGGPSGGSEFRWEETY